MNFHFFSDFESMSTAGFELIKKEVENKPDLLFCVASGGSPSGTYAQLAAHKKLHPEFGEQLRVIKLDEWGGLEPGSPFTSELDVQQKFVQPMGITADRYWTIDPDTSNPKGACLKMEQVLEQEGPLDICILGIGVNGHIALNEPGDAHQLPYHVCELAPSTLANGMLKTLKQPPSFGMTIGLRGIMQSKLILLFIAGSGKKEAFERLQDPIVSGQFPASFLWLHPNVQVLVDQRAV
jgi:galactosamine-6-phosphate isomerase